MHKQREDEREREGESANGEYDLEQIKSYLRGHREALDELVVTGANLKITGDTTRR